MRTLKSDPKRARVGLARYLINGLLLRLSGLVTGKVLTFHCQLKLYLFISICLVLLE